MPSGFSHFASWGPAQILFEALASTVAGIAVLLAFILLRRTVRTRYFRRLAQRSQEIRKNWDSIVCGDIPYESWFRNSLDHEIVESILLDRLEVAGPAETQHLHQCIRQSGLLDKRVREVRRLKGWRRRQALLALGRMGLPESIAALGEGLEDSREETCVDAVRGLGRVATPAAASVIIDRLLRAPLACPAPTLQSALLNCYRSHSSDLLRRTLEAADDLRPLLARVLAEVARRDTHGDLLTLAADSLPEVRAAAARALAAVRPPYALTALARLAADEEWFVRLRAVVALGDLSDVRGIPVLIEALRDANRFVRLRAAAALARFEGEEEKVLHLTVQTQDRYALQALVSEMQRSGRIPELVNALADPRRQPLAEPALLAALEAGSHQILIDLVLHHPNWRARKRLARLLARSGSQALLQCLEQMDLSLDPPRQRRVLRWLNTKLQETDGALLISEAALRT